MNLRQEMLDYRAAHGLTQSEFAKICGLSAPVINYIETGKRNPSRFTEARIRLTMDGKIVERVVEKKKKGGEEDIREEDQRA